MSDDKFRRVPLELPGLQGWVEVCGDPETETYNRYAEAAHAVDLPRLFGVCALLFRAAEVNGESYNLARVRECVRLYNEHSEAFFFACRAMMKLLGFVYDNKKPPKAALAKGVH